MPEGPFGDMLGGKLGQDIRLMNATFKRLWPWTVSGLLATGLAALGTWHLQQRAELKHLQQRLASLGDLQVELETLRLQNEQLRASNLQLESVSAPVETTRELMRLRNEVTRLQKQLAELEALREANARLLQALQNQPNLSPTQMAQVVEARKQGAILGVYIQPAPAGQSGVLVGGIDPRAPAARSGLRPGDLIYALDGKPIPNAGALQAEMLTRSPGQTVLLDVLRTNTPMRFQVQTWAWPDSR